MEIGRFQPLADAKSTKWVRAFNLHLLDLNVPFPITFKLLKV